jgi:hypothetical protein
MSRTKIEQYPNSLMTVSKILADRMFQDTPSIEKAKKINLLERQEFYKDKEKDKDNVDEFINKLVKIDGYITEITLFFDNSENQLEQRQQEREREERLQFGGYDELDDINRTNEDGESGTINSSRASGASSLTVGSGIKKRLRRKRTLRGGAGSSNATTVWSDDGSSNSSDYFGYAPSASTTSTAAQRRIAQLQLQVNRDNAQREDDRRSFGTSATSSWSESTPRPRPVMQEIIDRAQGSQGSEIGRDARGRPFRRDDLEHINAYYDGGDDSNSVSSGLNFKNLGIDKKQITYIYVILTKILEEISSINQFYKSKIFKRYKNISYFDIEMINTELITLYSKYNDLLTLIETYSFLDVKKITDKISNQFSKLYTLTKQINPSLNVANAQKQQFEIAIADDLAESQKLRRQNIYNRLKDLEQQRAQQADEEGGIEVESI